MVVSNPQVYSSGGGNFIEIRMRLHEIRYTVILQIKTTQKEPLGSPGIKNFTQKRQDHSLMQYNKLVIRCLSQKREFSSKDDKIQQHRKQIDIITACHVQSKKIIKRA